MKYSSQTFKTSLSSLQLYRKHKRQKSMLNSTLVTYQQNTVNERLHRTNNSLLQKINIIKTQIKLQRRGELLIKRDVRDVSGLPQWLSGQESACKGDTGSIPGSGRSPGGRHGNPLQNSCLENPHGQRSLQATVHGVTKSQTRLKWLSTHTCT